MHSRSKKLRKEILFMAKKETIVRDAEALIDFLKGRIDEETFKKRLGTDGDITDVKIRTEEERNRLNKVETDEEFEELLNLILDVLNACEDLDEAEDTIEKAILAGSVKASLDVLKEKAKEQCVLQLVFEKFKKED